MKHLFPTCTLCLLISGVRAAEPTVSSNDLPRFPPVEPKDALKTFKVRKGFHLELAASEPNVASPIAVSFDENGRMFVIEMIDYSERRDEVPHLGRVRLLEDTDGDGVYDKSTVFADNLPWPTAVFCCNGGILVAATPDILFLKDTNGDGQADTREVVFTGFAEGVKRLNVQAMLNSFIWGLDNRIHGATSGNGGAIKSLKHPEAKRVDLHGRDFAIDPRAMTLTSEPGGGQHGLSFDDAGRRFACNNSDHIRLFMYDDRYAVRNPLYSMPAPLASIAVDGPAAEVYRISPEEPWRVIRTRWRVAGLVSGPVEGGGRASGYFTGATGTTIYRGNAWPKEFLDNAFIGDAGGNLVHRKLLLPDDVGLKAQRPADEEKVEFVASTDTWFRPVQFANAPDGTLYVIDMYREIIEHPWSLPENIKKFLDLNSGNHRGRIYRIAPDGFKQPKPPQLGKAATTELVAMLENPNGWHRDTAARLLYERQDKQSIQPLTHVLEHSTVALARMHALHSLDGLDALTESHVLTGFKDADALVRERAVKLSEKFLANPSANLLAGLEALVSDSSARVRYQLAFTFGEIKGHAKIPALASIVKQDLNSLWIKAAILSSLAEGAGEMFVSLSADPKVANSKEGQEFLRQLILQIGVKNNPVEVAEALRFIKNLKPPLSFMLARGLNDGLFSAGIRLPKPEIQNLFTAATAVARDEHANETERAEGIRLLEGTTFAESGALLVSLLNQQQPQPVQSAALSTLSRFNDSRVGPAIADAWSSLTPRLRSEALTVLLSRPDRAIALLHAIQTNTIRLSVLSTTETKFLLNHQDKDVRDLAKTVLAVTPASTRQQVIDSFMAALDLKGDPVHGKKIFTERCFSCHRLGGEGFALGPDLVTVKNSGKEKILVNILDPNREVRPDFISYLVETKEDESLIGLVANETSSTITLRQAYGRQDVINRSRIKKMQSLGQSLMPDGLEIGLVAQDFADLISYIESADAGKK